MSAARATRGFVLFSHAREKAIVEIPGAICDPPALLAIGDPFRAKTLTHCLNINHC